MTLKTFLKGWEIVNMYKLFHEKSFSCIVSVFIIYSVLYMGLLTPVWALEPAPPGEIERLKAEGQFESSLEMAKRVGNHKVAPHLITKLKEKIRLLQEKRGQRHFGIIASPPPGRQDNPACRCEAGRGGGPDHWLGAWHAGLAALALFDQPTPAARLSRRARRSSCPPSCAENRGYDATNCVFGILIRSVKVHYPLGCPLRQVFWQ